MQKPICKLKTILRILLLLVISGVALLILEADHIPSSTLVTHAGLFLAFIVILYLGVEYIGVGKGYFSENVRNH